MTIRLFISLLLGVTIYSGLEVAYLGFGGLTTIIGVSMIIYFIWVGILGGLMWPYVGKINVK
jgi:hypothetical protein